MRSLAVIFLWFAGTLTGAEDAFTSGRFAWKSSPLLIDVGSGKNEADPYMVARIDPVGTGKKFRVVLR